MMNESIESAITELQKRTLEYYNSYSIIENSCELRALQKKYDFKTFDEGFRFHKSLFDKDQINNKLKNIIDKLLVNETNYFLDQIRNNSRHTEISDDIYDSIILECQNIVSSYRQPKSIMIPRKYLVSVPAWNARSNHNGSSWKKLHVGHSTPLNVIPSPLQIAFNDFIIMTENCNFWEYVPGFIESRLQIRSDLADQVEGSFWLGLSCRFTDICSDGNVYLINTMSS